MVSCRNPTGKLPKWLALVTPGNHSRADAAKVPVALMPAKPPADDRSLHSCVAPVFRWNNTDRLVEWIELNRLLGVQNFTFYLHSVSRQVARVLEFYRSRGLVTLVPWKLPSVIPVTTKSLWPPSATHLHYGGQIGAYNDCLLRNMHRAKWIMITDLDEMIVPRLGDQDSLPVILQHLKQQNSVTFLFNQFAFDIKPETRANASELFFPSFNRRKAVTDANLCKAIHLATGIEKVGVHNLFQSSPAYRAWGSDRVPSDVARLHHYRKVEASVQDTAMLRFADALLQRFKARKVELGLT